MLIYHVLILLHSLLQNYSSTLFPTRLPISRFTAPDYQKALIQPWQLLIIKLSNVTTRLQRHPHADRGVTRQDKLIQLRVEPPDPPTLDRTRHRAKASSDLNLSTEGDTEPTLAAHKISPS